MNIMKPLCIFLKDYMNFGIIILAAIELVLAIRSGIILVGLERSIKKLNEPHGKRKGKPQKLTERKISKERVMEVDWDEFSVFLIDYQNKGRVYSAFSLLIQIFTLLGILGTVAGLYIAMLEGQNIYEGVEFALSSTILGIICAVIYKIVDVIFEARLINYIEDGIARFETEYKMDSESSIEDKVREIKA